jgi:hypothetical protein
MKININNVVYATTAHNEAVGFVKITPNNTKKVDKNL